MAAKNNWKSAPDPETFIPERTGLIDMFRAPAAFMHAMQEGAGKPPLPPDPPRGSLTEGRDISAAFTELIREGMACAYALLQRGTQQAFRDQWVNQNWQNPWSWFAEERNGLVKSFMGDGGGSVYTVTIHRALRTWAVCVPRLFTDEEARLHEEDDRSWGDDPSKKKSTEFLLKYTSDMYGRHCEEHGIVDPQAGGLRSYRAEHYALPDMTDTQLRKHFARNPWPRWYRNGSTVDQFNATEPEVEGLPFGSTVIATSAEVTTEERYRRWIEEFIAEVEECVERFKDRGELRHELERMIAELKDFNVGQGEAKAFVEHLRATAAGRDVLRKMEDGKARLLLRLEDVRAEYAPAEAAASNGQRIRWKGNTQELAALIHVLETEGWIDGGRSRSQLATRVASLFIRSDGKPLDLATLKTYMAKAYKPNTRAGVEFTATKNPDKT